MGYQHQISCLIPPIMYRMMIYVTEHTSCANSVRAVAIDEFTHTLYHSTRIFQFLILDGLWSRCFSMRFLTTYCVTISSVICLATVVFSFNTLLLFTFDLYLNFSQLFHIQLII